MTNGFKPRPPSHALIATRKDNTKKKAKIGIAFTDQYGNLNIHLNPGVRISWDDDLWFRLVQANDGDNVHRSKREQEDEEEAADKMQKDDDDIPF